MANGGFGVFTAGRFANRLRERQVQDAELDLQSRGLDIEQQRATTGARAVDVQEGQLQRQTQGDARKTITTAIESNVRMAGFLRALAELENDPQKQKDLVSEASKLETFTQSIAKGVPGFNKSAVDAMFQQGIIEAQREINQSQSEGAFTLGQGQQRFGAGGEQVVGVPPAADIPSGAFVTIALPNGATAQVRSDDPRIDPAVAAGARVIDDDNIKFTDPVTGQSFVFSPATGQTTPLGAPSAAPAPQALPPPPEEQPVDITGGIDVLGEGTGPLDALAGFAERVPILSELVEGGDERQARNTFTILAQGLRRAFANNPRFAEGDIKRLQGLLPATGGFSTETAAFNDLTSLQRNLRAIVQKEQNVANDVNINPKSRSEAQQTIIDSEFIINQVSQILEASRLAAPLVTTQQQFDALEAGSIYRGADGSLRRKP